MQGVRGEASADEPLDPLFVVRPLMDIYFDGACEPINPCGLATYGCVLLRDGKVVEEGKGTVGTPGTAESTNNVAEYAGLLRGVDIAGRHLASGEAVRIFGDSQLVVRQIEGLYSVNAAHLKPLHAIGTKAIAGLRALGHQVELKWVPREKNTHADRLSKEAIKDALAENPGILDGIVISFGKHKGKKFSELPQDYRSWLWNKK